MELNVYLFFNGTCEDAMNFYKETLGGSIESMVRYGETPMPSADAQKNKVMHAVLNAAGTKLFFSDSNENHDALMGNNFSVSLSFGSDEEISRVFDAMSAGGKITMPLQDTFWNAKFGMCCDKFGVNWMFNFDKPKQ